MMDIIALPEQSALGRSRYDRVWLVEHGARREIGVARRRRCGNAEDASNGGAPELVEMRRDFAAGRQRPRHRWSTST